MRSRFIEKHLKGDRLEINGPIDGAQMLEICSALQTDPDIRTLRLEGLEGSEAFLRSVIYELTSTINAMPPGSLAGLELKVLGGAIPEEDAKELVKALANKGVKHVVLDNSGLPTSALKHLIGLLPKSSIESLDMPNSPVDTTVAQDVSKYLVHKRLKHLSLENGTIGIEGAKVIGYELPGSELDSLNLANTGICTEGALKIAGGMKNNPLGNIIGMKTGTLEHLDISGNEIGDAGALAILKNALDTNLKSLAMRKNGISVKLDNEGNLVKLLQQGILEKLDLSGNFITDGIGASIGYALKKSGLKELGLDDCGINETAAIISEESEGSQLKRLSMRGNNFEDDNLLEFFQYLPKSSLESIDLGKVGMNSAEKEAMITALVNPRCKVQQLNVSSGHTDAEWVGNLIEALPKTKLTDLNLDGRADLNPNVLDSIRKYLPLSKLEALSMSDCDIVLNELEPLVTSLPPTMRQLNLSDNMLEEEGVKLLIKHLPDTNLVELNVQCNGSDITPESLKTINDILAQNRKRLANEVPGTQVGNITHLGTLDVKVEKAPPEKTEEQKAASHVEAIKKEHTPPGFEGF